MSAAAPFAPQERCLKEPALLVCCTEPAGGESPRLQRLVSALRDAGIRAESIPAIRSELWVKLRDNLALNPISTLTLQTLGEMFGTVETSGLITAVMAEVDALAARLELPPLLPTAEERCAAMASSPQ